MKSVEGRYQTLTFKFRHVTGLKPTVHVLQRVHSPRIVQQYLWQSLVPLAFVPCWQHGQEPHLPSQPWSVMALPSTGDATCNPKWQFIPQIPQSMPNFAK